MTCPPLALVLSVIGIMSDDRKTYAIAMLLVSGIITLSVFWLFLGY
ncbi:MAG: hypothetical protein M1376_23150 [Planctomycetes bacterium]|nr:hypothetical protein [Planctomycetota bacterium]